MNEKMYDLLEKVQETAAQVGGTAADAAYGVSKRACALLSVAKLRIRLATLEGQVEGCFAELGELLYATHCGTPTDSEVLLQKLQEIDTINIEIDALRAQIGEAESQQTCPTCGAGICQGDRFCRECGGML